MKIHGKFLINTHPYLNTEIQTQITQCLELTKEVIRSDLLGFYLYGSTTLGGLQKYSDIDLLVVSNRPTALKEKTILVKNLLQISGVYMKSHKLPIEMTFVVHSDISPWHYPPHFDFQYGDWLRQEFEVGNMEPWPNKEMPQLAIMLTQLLLAHEVIFGPNPSQLIEKIPYYDFMTAISSSLDSLMEELHSDTRNVLLTYARIWYTTTTDSICSKSTAATKAIEKLPKEYQPVMQRALAICLGKEKEYWDDIKDLIQPCAEFMKHQIEKQICLVEPSTFNDRNIKIEK